MTCRPSRPPRCAAPLRYTAIGAALDMPVGSIGPTRARCLACLRRELARAAVPRPRQQPRVPPAALARRLPAT